MSDAPEVAPPASPERMPPWILRAIILFFLAYLATLAARELFHDVSGLLILVLVSLFLSLAIEPGVNRLSARGWRRGTATGVILLGVVVGFFVFIGAIGTLVGTQIADLLGNSEEYVTRTVDWVNDTFDADIDPQEVIEEINDPEGSIQKFIESQRDRAVRLSITALGVLLQALSVALFTFYLVADGPRLRRSICSRLSPERQQRVLAGWELAIEKTGGYLYSRALLAGVSAVFHWIVFQSVGTPAPVALALWVGLISQFLPVVGTYLAGVLPVVVTLINSPLKALIVLIAIIVYQQIENYLLAPRITARTMQLHPALAFGAALAGGAVLGPVGAILALPAAAMVQAIASNVGRRYDVVDSHLTTITPPTRRERSRKYPVSRPQAVEVDPRTDDP